MKKTLFLGLLTLVMSVKAHAQANTALSNLVTTAINQDLNFAPTGSYGVHSITTGYNDSLVLQTSADATGFGGAINLNAASSVQILSGGNSPILVDSATEVDVEATSGDVVLMSLSNGDVDVYADTLYVGTNHGLQLSPGSSAAACSSSTAGTLYYSPGGTGVADQLQVCMKAADDSYSWKNVNF